MHCSIIGTKYFDNQELMYDLLDWLYAEDPFITIRSGGTSKISRWAEEWAVIRGADWNTRFEYWNKSDIDIDFWLKCHADLLIDTEYGVVFWDEIDTDIPMLLDMARNMHVPLIIVTDDFNIL